MGEAVGREAIRIIRERTLKGKFSPYGSSGARAKRYNPDYAKRKGKPITPVTLRDTGEMLDSLVASHRFQGNIIHITVGFSTLSARRKKEYLQDKGAGPNQIKRRFFYITPTERQRLVRVALLNAL